MGKTVLVVDPNPSTRGRVEQAFAGTEFRALFAGGFEEAREHADNGSLDLILSAVRLPEGSGYELASSLRDQHPAALVFLMAGGFEVYDAARAKSSGVDGRISVPFTPTGLRARVEQAIGPLQVDDSTYPPVGLEPVGDALPSYTGPLLVEEVGPAPTPAVSEERLATFVPRDFRSPDPVSVDPAVVGPALEKAILEVLPEVVESVLRAQLASKTPLRSVVESAVRDAVAAHLSDQD
jgi:CheY-like chemotaxis protein